MVDYVTWTLANVAAGFFVLSGFLASKEGGPGAGLGVRVRCDRADARGGMAARERARPEISCMAWRNHPENVHKAIDMTEKAGAPG
jgi:hypothetical protein